MARTLREDAHLPAEGWSRWVRAMVPEPEEMVGQNYEPRSDGQTGVMCTNIRVALSDEMAQCGIYEWRAVKPNGDGPKVVYVGSTCREKPGSLRVRILEYCNNGSHKEDLINEALERQYELEVRVKPTGAQARVAAEEMENELLEKYDYAWNIRNNGALRTDILN